MLDDDAYWATWLTIGAAAAAVSAVTLAIAGSMAFERLSRGAAL